MKEKGWKVIYVRKAGRKEGRKEGRKGLRDENRRRDFPGEPTYAFRER
jgi:hypothetical protein